MQNLARLSLERIQSREKAPGWSLLLALFFVVGYLILWIAGQILAATLTGDFSNTLSIGALIGSLVVSVVVVQWAWRRYPKSWIDELRLRQSTIAPTYAVVLVGLGAAWAIDLIGVLLRLKGAQVIPPVIEVLRAPIGGVWIAAAIFAIVVQPVAEGLIFGGLLYPALVRAVGNNLFACLLVAIIYTLSTAAILSTGAETWYLLVQPFLMMLVVVLVRAYSQSTQSAIVTRALFGFFFVLAAVISLRF